MNTNKPSYREVELPQELPHESFSISWETYNELRLRVLELETALLTTQDAISDIRSKYEAFREKYAQWIQEEEQTP